MLRKQFTLRLVLVCSLLGCLGVNAQGTQGQIVFVRFHIKNKVISYVASQVAVGEASDRQMLGDFRVVVYASDHQTVLEEYRIPDPRKGHGPEDPEAGITLGPIISDDIDFDLVFPLQEGLRYVDIYDNVDELRTSVDISEDLVSVEPFTYLIASENITATASSSYDESTGPENTVNGSGLYDDDLHSAEQTDMWLSSPTGPQPTWIQYEFDRIYKLQEMWVWNFNQGFEPVLGFGLKDVSIAYSADGIYWIEPASVLEFAQAPGAVGYAHNTTFDFGGVEAKYVKITANSNWGGFLNQYGLSEIYFFYAPFQAPQPAPDSGATGMDLDLVLGWRARTQAAKHEVYFSSEERAVIDRTIPISIVTKAVYDPLSLDLGKTYYWRVDEVSEVEIPAIWEGGIWKFTTREHFIVDDFESYDDYKLNRIFDTIDGWDIATTYSTVGYVDTD